MARRSRFRIEELDAVLFDMDGVVTDTVAAHAAAWKLLFDAYLTERARRSGEAARPFDAERDYHEYVDGKPRYDGVASFLAARGITLPHGAATDGPERETVCGLGNRENDYFEAWLQNNRVQAFPGTLAFIRRIKQAGLKTGLFSSSRHAERILGSAGILDLFEARVDGNDLIKYGLPGKPDPAMLLAAARRLGVPPQRVGIVEDAIAGVEAGIRGGFRFVIGVDRGHNAQALRQAGAMLVVRDLDEVECDGPA